MVSSGLISQPYDLQWSGVAGAGANISPAYLGRGNCSGVIDVNGFVHAKTRRLTKSLYSGMTKVFTHRKKKAKFATAVNSLNSSDD